MPTQLGEEFDPRSVIPLSDSEIEALYEQAEKKEQQRASEKSAPFSLIALDALGWFFFAQYLLRGRPIGLSPIVAYLLLLIVVASLSSRGAGGILTAIYRSKSRPKRREPDLNDLSVLAVVVNQIAIQPLQQAAKLQAKIEGDRKAIAESLTELDQIEAALRDELRGTEDEPMRLLLESKRHSAQRALDRLNALDVELALQLREAAEAVLPVRQMQEKFERLSRLSTSLSRIRAAHRLAEEGEGAVEEQKLELQILRSVVQEANAKLLDIERLVDAQERARAELGI